MSEILKNADMTIKMLILFQKFSLQSKLDKVKLIATVIPRAKRPIGTSRQAGIRKLRNSRPDLLQRVFDKEMTVNQAMIEAGFRKKRIMVYAEIEPVVKKLKEEFSQEDLDRIIEMLQRD